MEDVMLQIDCHVLPHLTLTGRFCQRRGWNHDGRTIEKHMLMVMWQGECRLSVGDETHFMNRGDAMIIPAGQYYRPHTEEGCEYYYFYFSIFPNPNSFFHHHISLH